MEASSAYLALYLDAPLQSWGYQSRFDRRTTLSYPTRSGIVGIICAAMGIDRGDTVRLAELAGLAISVFAFRQQGRLIDFHTVGGGWGKTTHRQNIVRTADGGVGNTVVTRREYLQNARFGAVVGGDRQCLSVIAAALRNPQWGIWLGRKSCIPATPVLQGMFDDADSARGHLENLAGGQALRKVVEVANFEDGSDTLMDTPLDFARRDFAPRRILVE